MVLVGGGHSGVGGRRREGWGVSTGMELICSSFVLNQWTVLDLLLLI